MAAAGDRDVPRRDETDEADGGRDGSPDLGVLVAAGIGVFATVIAGVGSIGAVATGELLLAAGLITALLIVLVALSAGSGDSCD